MRKKLMLLVSSNISIERDVQGLSLVVAPHVKR